MRRLMYATIGFSTVTFAMVNELALLYTIALLLGLVVLVRCDKRKICHLMLGGLFGGLYFLGYTHYYHFPLAQYHGQTLRVSAIILDYPQQTSYGYSVIGDVLLEKETKTLLYFDEQGKDLVPGDQIEMITYLRLSDQSSTGVDITYYTSKGILLIGETFGSMALTPVEGFAWSHLPAILAKKLKNNIAMVFPEQSAAVISALVLGNRENLSDQFSSSLQRTGMSHTVAVSGMHFAFLAGILSFCLPRGRLLSAVIIIFVIIGFMLITGASPSIIRASVMIIMLQIAPIFKRERDSFTSLSFALLLILLQNPYTIAHLGLQLSLGAVAGIFLFGEPMTSGIYGFFFENKPKKGLKYAVISIIGTTFSAMLITTPLLAYYFETVSLIAPLSNLASLWAISILFSGGLIAGVLGGIIPLLGEIIAYALLPLVKYLDFVVTHLGSSALASITMNSFYYRVWLVSTYLILILILFFNKEKSYIIPICCIVCTFCVAVYLHCEDFHRNAITMKVLNVGQGQSVLFGLGGNLVLVDCGGDCYEGADYLAANAINDLGRTQLDLLILTHCHYDHAGGVLGLLDRVKIAYIAMPYPETEHEIQDALIEKATRLGTEILYIQSKTTITLDELRQIVLFPPLGSGDMNEMGITALISAGDQDVLLTGDMGASGELALIANFEIPDIEVLMVGHHGSNYSSHESFLAAISPEYAVISTGPQNRYGHPHESTLERLQEVGAEIYRTDTMGNITLTRQVETN